VKLHVVLLFVEQIKKEGRKEGTSKYSAKLSCINVSQFARVELKSKSFPVEKLSAEAAGFLIGGGSLAYRLDSTWKLIDWRRRRTAAVPGSTL